MKQFDTTDNKTAFWFSLLFRWFQIETIPGSSQAAALCLHPPQSAHSLSPAVLHQHHFHTSFSVEPQVAAACGLLLAAFNTVIIKLTRSDAPLQRVETGWKKSVKLNGNDSVDASVLPLCRAATLFLREMFVVSHQAHGASSKPVCELKCSSINCSTV